VFLPVLSVVPKEMMEAIDRAQAGQLACTCGGSQGLLENQVFTPPSPAN
jgi:hypothetical protein